MAKIPSTEQTHDFIYRIKMKHEVPSNNHKSRNSLVFEHYTEPVVGTLHSMDVTIVRDGQRATDIEFRSFEHLRELNMIYLKFVFHDKKHQITEHNYLLTIVLRYLI
jgi:hypothetical protein